MAIAGCWIDQTDAEVSRARKIRRRILVRLHCDILRSVRADGPCRRRDRRRVGSRRNVRDGVRSAGAGGGCADRVRPLRQRHRNAGLSGTIYQHRARDAARRRYALEVHRSSLIRLDGDAQLLGSAIGVRKRRNAHRVGTRRKVGDRVSAVAAGCRAANGGRALRCDDDHALPRHEIESYSAADAAWLRRAGNIDYRCQVRDDCSACRCADEIGGGCIDGVIAGGQPRETESSCTSCCRGAIRSAGQRYRRAIDRSATACDGASEVTDVDLREEVIGSLGIAAEDGRRKKCGRSESRQRAEYRVSPQKSLGGLRIIPIRKRRFSSAFFLSKMPL